MTDQTSGLSRRTIAKGAAWAVPVLTLTAAPLQAASQVELPPCVKFAFSGDACRRSNEAIYKFGFTIANGCEEGTFNVCVTSLENGASKVMVPASNALPLCSSLAPGGTLEYPTTTWRAASQSQTVFVYGTVNGGPAQLLFSVDAPQKSDACATGA